MQHLTRGGRIHDGEHYVRRSYFTVKQEIIEMWLSHS